MIDLFYGKGPLNDEEVKEFLDNYRAKGHHNWRSEVELGIKDEYDAGRVNDLFNQSMSNMGNLADRLALTIDRLDTERQEVEVVPIS